MLKPLSGFWGAAFKIAGASETVAYLQAEAEANWLQKHQPEIWKATHKFLFLSGYLTFRLIGRFVDSVGCQVGYIPFDYKKQDWEASWGWKWQAVPVDKVPAAGACAGRLQIRSDHSPRLLPSPASRRDCRSSRPQLTKPPRYWAQAASNRTSGV